MQTGVVDLGAALSAAAPFVLCCLLILWFVRRRR